MFLSRVQIGSYRVWSGLFGSVIFGSGSIRVGSFSVPVLSGKKSLEPKWYAQNGKDGFGRVFDMNREGDGTSGTGMEWMDRQEMRNDSWYTTI